MSEIPTNRIRAYNVALASFTHWVHNLAVSKATPVMLVTTPYGAYFIFGSVNFVMAIIAFWVPETKGVSVVPPTTPVRDVVDPVLCRSRWSVWTKSLVQSTFRVFRMLALLPSWRLRMKLRMALPSNRRHPWLTRSDSSWELLLRGRGLCRHGLYNHIGKWGTYDDEYPTKARNTCLISIDLAFVSLGMIMAIFATTEARVKRGK